jgi:hypothetical protein
MPEESRGPRWSGTLAVDAALFAVVLMWAATFTLFKIAWHDIDPVAFTGIRDHGRVLGGAAGPIEGQDS